MKTCHTCGTDTEDGHNFRNPFADGDDLDQWECAPCELQRWKGINERLQDAEQSRSNLQAALLGELSDEMAEISRNLGLPELGRNLGSSLRSQLLTPAQLRGRPRAAHLIKGVLKLSSATWLIGAPGSYKSFVALDWAAHVASGKDWNGRKVAKRKVIYVLAEGAESFQDRITAWEMRHAEQLDDLLILPVAVQARGDDGRGISPAWRELAALVAEEKPGLVVLDTQARLSVGLEENSNTEMGVWVQAVDMVKRAADCCALVVHHTGRNGGDARGASAIDGAQDAEWRVDKDKDRSFTLSCDKMKDGADDLRMSFLMDVVDVGFDEDGEKLTSLVIGSTVNRRGAAPAVEQVELTASEGRAVDCYGLVHRILSELDPHRDGLTLTELVNAATKALKAAGREPFAKESVRSALNAGRSKGAIVKLGRSNWALDEDSEAVAAEHAENRGENRGSSKITNGLPNGFEPRLATVDPGLVLPPLPPLSSANAEPHNGSQRFTTVD